MPRGWSGLILETNKKGELQMATNPVGKGTKTVGINMPASMAVELERRAGSMKLSKSKYCKLVLSAWLKSGEKLVLQETGI